MKQNRYHNRARIKDEGQQTTDGKHELFCKAEQSSPNSVMQRRLSTGGNDEDLRLAEILDWNCITILTSLYVLKMDALWFKWEKIRILSTSNKAEMVMMQSLFRQVHGTI